MYCLLMSTKCLPLLATQCECVNFELLLFQCLKYVCKSPRNLSSKTGDMAPVTCLAVLRMRFMLHFIKISAASVSIFASMFIVEVGKRLPYHCSFTDAFWRSFELGGGLFRVFSSLIV